MPLDAFARRSLCGIPGRGGGGGTTLCRLGSSDLAVFEQVFVEEHYNSTHLPDTAETIFDLGANIGASTSWLAERYPTARVVAVEPDSRNFWMLRRNTEHYGTRVIPVKGGVWSHPTRLDLRPGHDSKPWSIRVVEDPTGPLEAYSIDELMTRHACERIDILKMDIERAEEVVLSHCDKWIASVGVLLVEFHSERGLRRAADVLDRYMTRRDDIGETSVFTAR